MKPFLLWIIRLRLQSFYRGKARKIQGARNRSRPERLAEPLAIYTDGAVDHDCYRGGWAFVAYEDGKEAYAELGSTFRTTSPAEELRAVIQALLWLHPDRPAILWTDSQDIADGATLHREAWKARDWRTRSGRTVSNLDQWRALDALLDDRLVEVRWCPGHAKVVGNERADGLAVLARNLPLQLPR